MRGSFDIKTAIHCPTQELWNKVTEELKLKWNYLSIWEIYEEDSCIHACSESFSSLEYMRDNNYKIISAKEFLGLEPDPEITAYEVIKTIPSSMLKIGQVIWRGNSIFEQCQDHPDYFKPHYKPLFEVCDWIFFQESTRKIDFGAVGKITKIFRKGSSTIMLDVLVNDVNIYNIEASCVRKATPAEIERAQTIEVGGSPLTFSSSGVFVNGRGYGKDEVLAFISFIEKHSHQIKGIKVGCSGQYTLDLAQLQKIAQKLK